MAMDRTDVLTDYQLGQLDEKLREVELPALLEYARRRLAAACAVAVAPQASRPVEVSASSGHWGASVVLDAVARAGPRPGPELPVVLAEDRAPATPRLGKGARIACLMMEAVIVAGLEQLSLPPAPPLTIAEIRPGHQRLAHLDRRWEAWWKWHDEDPARWSPGWTPDRHDDAVDGKEAARCLRWTKGETDDGPPPEGTP